MCGSAEEKLQRQLGWNSDFHASRGPERLAPRTFPYKRLGVAICICSSSGGIREGRSLEMVASLPNQRCELQIQ